MNIKNCHELESSFATIKMKNSLPTPNSIDTIFNEMDYSQAIQLYLWALPLVAFAKWQQVHEEEFSATSGDLVTYKGYAEVSGILTANATTPYTIGFIDLSKTGPMIIEMPKGHIAGGFSDFWQREVAAVGEMGPDRGEGGKYILLPPNQEDESLYLKEGYFIIRNRSMNTFFGIRTLDPDSAVCETLANNVHIYPYSEKENPSKTNIYMPNGRKYYAGPPKGLEYWEILHAIIQHEVIEERDRFFIQWLDNLGVKKDNEFKLTGQQIEILIAAAEKGEQMAQVNSFAKRFLNNKHWKNRNWDYIMIIPDSNQRGENFDFFFERTSYFYEAVTYSKAMITKTSNVGQAYLGAYQDKKGQWLDGGINYRLKVPANPPAVNFWSITVYDSITRCLIQNEQQNADISSRKNIQINSDGSVDIYFGPNAPMGHETNWVQTNENEFWFAYLRLYGPTEQYFNKSWVLGDIEEI